jgi:2-methylisocitrate lyase-like PEP mutase family enzyme
MRLTQTQKAERFQALHAQPGAFVIPNPWDAGTARILASLGFQALTTTETIRLAGEAGLVGGSIEDASGDPYHPIYDFQHAVERIAAAVEAARAFPFPFVLVGRAENFLHGRPDLDDTIRRLQAFEAAGADALFAPGITGPEDIRTVCAAVGKPVNVVMGLKGVALSVDELAELGVKRISLGSALSRVALGAVIRAAREIREHGTFRFADDALPYAEANDLVSGTSGAS